MSDTRPSATEALGPAALSLCGDALRLDRRLPHRLLWIAPYAGRSEAVVSHLGLPLPSPGRITEGRAATLLPAGPNAWFLLVRERTADCGDFHGLEAALEIDAAIVDLTGSRWLFTLEGEGARDLLTQGCALDLRARTFPPGSSALTTLAYCTLLLLHRKQDAFEMLVPWSYSQDLWLWLQARSHGKSRQSFLL